ncbi:MAG: tetratricopeptide repeat protein [Aquimonas sp.]|nr:tetratricopeptide repeat protein [Aquimonas sp.]
MSLEQMDEYERGERVRRWVKDNASSMLGGVSVGLLAFLGWQWYQQGQAQQKVDAAAQFANLREAVEVGNSSEAGEVAQGLADRFAKSPYAAMAQLQMAQIHAEAGDIDASLTALQRARSLSPEPLLAQLAELRIARLKYGRGEHDEALTLLQGMSGGYAGLVADLRGDILRAQGRRDEAIDAYQDALTHLQEGVQTRGLVELKLADLGVIVERGS